MLTFALDKAALIDLVEQIRCVDVYAFEPPANYQQLFDAIFQDIGLYDCEPDIVIEMLGVFDDTTLVANGIYLEKIGTTVTNPVAIVNSTFDDVNIDAGGNYPMLQIISNSVVARVTISNNTTGIGMIVSGGATVGQLEVEAGSCIDLLLVKACEGHNSTVDRTIQGACIQDIGIDPDAVFNGYCTMVNVSGEGISLNNIVVERGDTVRFRFWSNAAKTVPIDLSTSTFTLEVYDPDGIIFIFNSTNGLTITGVNILQLVAGPTSMELPQGQYEYVLKRTFDGSTKIKMQGSFKITDPGI